jgi:Tol biopolymer transport system component
VKVLLPLALLAVAACGDLPPAPRILPLNRVNAPGVLLSPTGSSVVTNPVWSADGSRVYVGLAMPAGSAYEGIHEITVSSHADRVLIGSVTPSSLRIAPNGGLLYFTNVGALWRILSGGGALQEVRGQVAYLVHLTDDSTGLVFDWPNSDSVWVIGSQSGTATALPPGGPLVYSPAGDQMLYCCSGTGGSASSTIVVSLLDGTTRPSGLTVASGAYWVGTRWGADGIEMLLAHYHPNSWRVDYTILGPAGSETAAFSDTIAAPTYVLVWSPDGSRVAFWKSACVSWYSSIGECGVHSALYVADLHTGVTTWVAGSDFDAEFGDIACPIFSPDGRALMYVLGGQLYFLRIP